MAVGLANRWATCLYETMEADRAAADDLRDAALQLDLARWTGCLTGVVVRAFEGTGFVAAAKGFRGSVLPVRRQEYLGQDVMAFAPGSTGWRFPAAVCELENSADDDVVAYSLWKVLCVRVELRVVFCYRAEPGSAPGLVGKLANEVVQAIPVADRSALGGETLVIVGSRNEASAFPYGFFRAWKLNLNTGRFESFARQ